MLSRFAVALSASLTRGVHVSFDAAAKIHVASDSRDATPVDEVTHLMSHLQEVGFTDLGWDANTNHFNRLRMFAKQSQAKTVCATGFGAGVSAMAFLSASPETKVVGFDSDEGYVRSAEAFLKQQFGAERLQVIFGHRNATVLQQSLPGGARCDAAVVGNAHDWETAVGDIQNLKDISKPGGMLLVENCHPDHALRGRDKHDLHDRFKINFAYKAAQHRGFLVHQSYFETAECLNQDDANGFGQCRETCVARFPGAQASASGMPPLQEVAQLLGHLQGGGFEDLGYSADTAYFSRMRDLGTLVRPKALCVTGFGSGATALAFLSANPDTTVYAFDAGAEGYVQPAEAHLKEHFGERLSLALGDVAETLEQAAADGVRCDAAVVAAETTEAAVAYLEGLKAMTRPGGYVLVENCHFAVDDSDAVIRGPSAAALAARPQVNSAYKEAQAHGWLVHKEFVYTSPCLNEALGQFSSCREVAVGRFAGGPEEKPGMLFD